MNKRDKKINYEHPVIIDNRIVSNITFAVRFKSFVKDIQVNCPAGYEELEYMQRTADRLLALQLETCVDEDEINYFKNIGYNVEEKKH